MLILIRSVCSHEESPYPKRSSTLSDDVEIIPIIPGLNSPAEISNSTRMYRRRRLGPAFADGSSKLRKLLVSKFPPMINSRQPWPENREMTDRARALDDTAFGGFSIRCRDLRSRGVTHWGRGKSADFRGICISRDDTRTRVVCCFFYYRRRTRFPIENRKLKLFPI